MTLEEVVSVIQETKRPNIMVLTSEHEVESLDKNSDGDTVPAKGVTGKRFVSPLDLAFGFANKLAAEGGKGLGIPERHAQGEGHQLKPAISGNSLIDEDEEDDDDGVSPENDDEEEVLFKSPGKEFTAVDYDDGGGKVLDEEPQSNSTKPTCYDIDILLEYAAHRTNTHKDAETLQMRSVLLKRASLFNSDVRMALRLSLVECCRDPRRYSFLEHFFKNTYRSRNERKAKKERSGYEAKVAEENDVTSSVNQRRLLELYMELLKFRDVIAVCSASDREKLLDHAQKISRLFLSEDGASPDQSNDDRLSEYVAHVALGGTEKVQAVRFALRDEDEFFEGRDDGDGFHGVRSSLEEFLSIQESFLSFLFSDDCTRMRAYFRGSSPFLSVEPQYFLKSASNDSTHHNFLLHAILHLICMKASTGDNESKHEEDNFIKNDALLLNTGERNMGAASLLSCSMFIMRSLQNSMKAAAEGLIEDDMAGTGNNMQIYSALIEDVQFFWEVYIAPAGGALSSLPLPQYAQDPLNDVRRLTVLSVDEVMAQDEKPGDAIPLAAMARVLSSAEMSKAVHSLAEALLREYTLSFYPKFSRHVFHEWACSEALERCYGAKDNLTAIIDEYLVARRNNGLSKGWMNRFLRQMEFPGGMSLHRPSPSMLLPAENDITYSSTSDPPAALHNGDVALVFGSDARDERGDQLQRFSCVSIQPDTDGPRKKVLFPDDVPPIFESYAAVPPFHERPFQGILKDKNNSRIR